MLAGRARVPVISARSYHLGRLVHASWSDIGSASGRLEQLDQFADGPSKCLRIGSDRLLRPRRMATSTVHDQGWQEASSLNGCKLSSGRSETAGTILSRHLRISVKGSKSLRRRDGRFTAGQYRGAAQLRGPSTLPLDACGCVWRPSLVDFGAWSSAFAELPRTPSWGSA